MEKEQLERKFFNNEEPVFICYILKENGKVWEIVAALNLQVYLHRLLFGL